MELSIRTSYKYKRSGRKLVETEEIDCRIATCPKCSFSWYSGDATSVIPEHSLVECLEQRISDLQDDVRRLENKPVREEETEDW